MPRSFGSSLLLLKTSLLLSVVVVGLTPFISARAQAAAVPFTGNLTIDFTANGGTSLVIPGAGMATLNGAGSPSFVITKLTIPPGAFTGTGLALVDSLSIVPAYYGVGGVGFGNAAIVLSQGATCTAGHPQVGCPGGGLAGFGGIPGLAGKFLLFSGTVGNLLPTGNIGAGSQAQGTYTARVATLSAAGWTTGVANAFASNFTGSQAVVGNTVSLSLVSPIAITGSQGGGGAGVARLDLILSGLTICGATSAGGCLTSAGASLQIKDHATDDTKDQLKWNWKKGDAVAQLALGDPDTTAVYSLCIYDTTGGIESLVGFVRVDPNANWVTKDPKGWQYKDTTGAEDGVQKVQLKTGAAGKSKAQLRAKGTALGLPTPFSGTEIFNQDTKVIVQLVNNQNATCWTSEFTTAKTNTLEQFKATAP